MKVSLNVTNYTWPDAEADSAALVAHLRAVAKAADDGGLDTLWINDHLLQNDPGAAPTERDMLEAYTTLGFLAAATTKVKLGTMVSAITYRAPMLLLKAATTLDVLSEGRAWLGLGAGYPGEAEQLALPMPPVGERFDLLADTLALAQQMWAGKTGPFTGSVLSIGETECEPPPVRAKGVPVLIGGAGEQRTLRLVAEYADACNLFDIPDEGRTLRHKLEVLRAHCDDVGRDPIEVETTVSTRLSPDESAEQFADRCRRLEQWGAEHVVVITPGAWTPDRVDTLVAAANLLAA